MRSLWKNVYPSVAEISPPESLELKIPQQTILIVLQHVYWSVCACVDICVCPVRVRRAS